MSSETSEHEMNKVFQHIYHKVSFVKAIEIQGLGIYVVHVGENGGLPIWTSGFERNRGRYH